MSFPRSVLLCLLVAGRYATTPVNAKPPASTTSPRNVLNKKPNVCDLCADNWIIVVGTGRSGSTTIADMLNQVPGVYTAGELSASSTYGADISTTMIEMVDMVLSQDADRRSGPRRTYAKV